MIYKSIFSSPLGFVEICADGTQAITRAYFTSTPSAEYTENEITRRARAQLEEYFAGNRRCFDVPLAPEGSDFQKQVWDMCKTIPYGESRTFKELAAMLGDSGTARKVGAAVEENPICIFIPAHRVTGKMSFLAALSSNNAVQEALLGAEQAFLR